jgi:ABC-type transport system involved in cytochrome bd biosynthesis fused ATPase/permease subunit
MPDSVEKLIYKLEIDGSGYISGVESLSASTARFTKEQEAANATLKTNEAALKANTDRLARARKDLEDYNGTNARYRKQLENDVKSAEKDQQQLTELVDKNRIAYEKATQAASDFANVARKATEVQGGAGRVPIPSAVPSPVIPNLQQALNNISLGDLPDTLERTIPEFEALRKVIGLAEERMKNLNN